MGGILGDVRFAIRALMRRPVFTTVAVVTAALGIGAASAVYAVVDAVVFRPLPYPEPGRLVALWTRFDGQGDFMLSSAEHFDFAEESRALEALGSVGRDNQTLTGPGGARRVEVAWSFGELYQVIGARTVLGRLPTAEETRPGAPTVVVISHSFWSSELAGDPGAVGGTLELDGQSVEVIGVMAPTVRLPTWLPEIWRPIRFDRAQVTDRSGHFLEGIGRLAPDRSVASLRSEIDDTHARWSEVWAGAHSPGHSGHALAIAPLHNRYFGELRSAATMLLASVLLVLLLACGNVASILLARAEGRAGDLALRRALGAGRGRIVRLLLTESLLLGVAGGGLGLILAVLGADLLVALEPGDLPRTDLVGLDVRVTLFALAVSLASGLAFGAIPALRSGASAARGERGVGSSGRALSRPTVTSSSPGAGSTRAPRPACK